MSDALSDDHERLPCHDIMSEISIELVPSSYHSELEGRHRSCKKCVDSGSRGDATQLENLLLGVLWLLNWQGPLGLLGRKWVYYPRARKIRREGYYWWNLEKG